MGSGSSFVKLKRIDSPTNRVGGVALEKFNQIEHKVPMLSLSNAYSDSDLKDFDKRVRDMVKDEIEYLSNAYEEYTSGYATSIVRSTSEQLFEQYCEEQDVFDCFGCNDDCVYFLIWCVLRIDCKCQ